jgi:ribosomal protein S18 acetylase RimI-like enzyme
VPEPRGRGPARAARAADVADAADAPAAFVVRRATAADLDEVVALRLALLRAHGGNPVYGRLREDAPARARALFRDQLASTQEVTWLAVRPDTGAAVGILRCMEGRGSPLLDPPRYGYVASVYVVPGARRAGVLRALLGRAVDWSRERGLDELRLHAASDNADGLAAWQAMGFAVAEHLLVRPLDPGPP